MDWCSEAVGVKVSFSGDLCALWGKLSFKSEEVESVFLSGVLWKTLNLA